MAEAPSPGSKRPGRPPVAVVGAGAVGSALARRLQGAGYPIAAVLSRSARSAQTLAADVEAAAASSALEALPQETRLLFLCVPDAQVRPVAEALAGQAHPWPHCFVAHTSGVLPAAALAPLAEAGATTLSFHPLQAFTQGATAEAFDGIYVGMEGTEEAVLAGEALAEALRVRTVVVPEEEKARYHMAASMTSNFLVTLLALAREVLEDVFEGAPAASGARGAAGPDGADPLRPLLEGTLRNLRTAAPAAALTGPAARGDEETVAAHLQALHTHHPGLVPVYTALTTETVRLAVRTDRLSSAAADRLLDQLSTALETHDRAEL